MSVESASRTLVRNSCFLAPGQPKKKAHSPPLLVEFTKCNRRLCTMEKRLRIQKLVCQTCFMWMRRFDAGTLCMYLLLTNCTAIIHRCWPWLTATINHGYSTFVELRQEIKNSQALASGWSLKPQRRHVWVSPCYRRPQTLGNISGHRVLSSGIYIRRSNPG